MEASPLGKLPPELRNKISELAMTCDSDIQFLCEGRDFASAKVCLANSDMVWDVIGSLPATCRQSRAETSGLFWSNNVTVTLNVLRLGYISIPDVPGIMACGTLKLVEQIGKHASQIRHLDLHVGVWTIGWMSISRARENFSAKLWQLLLDLKRDELHSDVTIRVVFTLVANCDTPKNGRRCKESMELAIPVSGYQDVADAVEETYRAQRHEHDLHVAKRITKGFFEKVCAG